MYNQPRRYNQPRVLPVGPTQLGQLQMTHNQISRFAGRIFLSEEIFPASQRADDGGIFALLFSSTSSTEKSR